MKSYYQSANLCAAWLCGWVMLMHCSASAADAEYREPNSKVIASVESTAASLKAAPHKQPRRVLVYGISFGPHRTTIRTAQQVFALLGTRTALSTSRRVKKDFRSLKP